VIAQERRIARVASDVGAVVTPRRRAWTPLGAVLVLLPFAALVELLLTRTFYRVGVYIPKEGAFGGAYGLLTAVGSFALDHSSVLVVVTPARRAARGLRGGGRSAGAAIVAFLVAWAVVRIGGVETFGPTARLTFALAVLALAAPFVRGDADRLHRAAVAGVAACFLLSTYAGIAAEGERLAGTALPGGVGAQLLAEALVVAAALLVGAAWIATDGFRIRPALLAAPLAAALLALWSANGAITGILVLWTAGLRLYLPIGLYALALWAILAATIGWLPRQPRRSAGLALLLVAGMLLGNTYLQALGLAALALLTDGRAVGGLPDLRRS
jgi:hypothetical protein